MENYAAAVAARSWLLPRPVALCAWSMGGLAAMMAAERAEPAGLVLLEPSAPAEVRGEHAVDPAEGAFDPETVYGPFPPGVLARPESSLARAERERGISVPALPGRTLVVYGDEFAEERGRALARRYGTEELEIRGASHWDLVLRPDVRAQIAARLSETGRIIGPSASCDQSAEDSS
jgi:hypothetical protein